MTTTGDSGDGSLRAAIVAAGKNPGVDTIAFDIPGAGIQTIAPSSPLPRVFDNIDGTTQPGYNPEAPAPVIEISGAQAGPAADGLVSSGNIKALTINGFSRDGIVLGGGAQVTGCYIGTTASGAAAAPNGGNGITINSGGATIGGPTPADRNVVSGNRRAGVAVYGGGFNFSNRLLGNYIGTDAAGTSAVGNGHEGVVVTGAAQIGGVGLNRNVISGNAYSGLLIDNANVADVTGNYIGSDVSGTKALGNGTSPAAPWRDGVTIFNSHANIGATDPVQWLGNLISANYGAGVSYSGPNDSSGPFTSVSLVRNLIGTDITGRAPLGNAGDGVLVGGAGLAIGNAFASGGPAGNVISGNGGNGIRMARHGANVEGNLIGTTSDGNVALPNHGNGIEADNAFTMIGDNTPAARNIISGNAGNGIVLRDGAGGRVEGNYIGLGAGGNPVGNAGNGVLVINESVQIGLSTQADGNVISANGGSGIYVTNPLGGGGSQIVQNLIGTDPHGNAGTEFGNGRDGITLNVAHSTKIIGNTIADNSSNGVTVTALPGSRQDADQNLISQNSIFDNGGLGIDLGDDGPTPNQPPPTSNPSQQPNRLVQFPTIVSAVAFPDHTQLMVRGTGTIEIFSNALPDPSGFGEGQKYLATAKPGSVRLPVLPVGTVLSATATDDRGDTSEFSADVAVMAAPPATFPAADINRDGVVGFADLLVLSQNFGRAGGTNQGDLNGDGMINLADLLLLAQDYTR